VELALTPEPGDAVTTAVLTALAREGVGIGDEPHALTSPWRIAGLAEGVERAPSAVVLGRYSALSPRSTRGATRA
jgi:hypothetical protein